MQNPEMFSSEEIDYELQRVLGFAGFKSSPTLSKFLEYIVTETVQNRFQSIKEYNIAVDVLKRPPGFNCNDDAVVRIHAGRLRRALDQYYNGEGKNNPIYIEIPKGSYIPHFTRRSKVPVKKGRLTPDPSPDKKPIVAIFPFKSLSEKKDHASFSLLLAEEVSAELSRFQDISVIGYFSKEMTSNINHNILEAGKLLNADYIINGCLQFIEKRVRIRINLLSTATGEVMMTKLIDKVLKYGMFEICDEIVQSFLGALGGYYGSIFQEIARESSMNKLPNAKIRDGVYSYYRYQRSFSVENFKGAVTALQETVNTHPKRALALAMLGELYLDGILLAIETVPDPLKAGYECSANALKIDPNCRHALHNLTWVNLLRKDNTPRFNSPL
ncbi:hypothetical protein [Flavobacterium olei]|uniref:hypothetical protein n=1 Tax=Flavobacterium olei TaxID=1886782 RepID=UPI003219595F